MAVAKGSAKRFRTDAEFAHDINFEAAFFIERVRGIMAAWKEGRSVKEASCESANRN